jgi:hypothetical protein
MRIQIRIGNTDIADIHLFEADRDLGFFFIPSGFFQYKPDKKKCTGTGTGNNTGFWFRILVFGVRF